MTPNEKLAEQAKKRRARLLASFERKSQTISDFAKIHKVTPQRMSDLLIRAKKERDE